MSAMFHLRPFAVAALFTASACAKTPANPWAHDTSVNPGYHVVGNQVLDMTGKVHYFHGVDRPSLEQSPNGEALSADDFKLMAKWNANVVRIALNQDYWLFGSGSSSYQQTVLRAVEWAKKAGMDVILDLHWSDQGKAGGGPAGQQKMADTNSIAFWKSVADFYKDDGRVIFELYNEPFNVAWDIWLNGGDAGGYTAVGMQQLYDAVRSTGAQNIVIAGGLNWAFDLSGVATHLIKGDNIMYATHPYGTPDRQPPSWDSKFGYLTATHPVIATEFGATDDTTDYPSQVIDYADLHGIHWTAWAWCVAGVATPNLLADWSGTPTPLGQVVKNALARYATQGMPIPEDGGIPQPRFDAPTGNDVAIGIDGRAGLDGVGAIDLPVAVDLPAAVDGTSASDLPMASDLASSVDGTASEAGGID